MGVDSMDPLQEMVAGFEAFFRSLTQVQHLWQLPVLMVALLVGVGASIAMGKRLPGAEQDPEQQRRLRAIAFALVSGVALLLFGRYFGHGRPSALLRVATDLLFSLAIARIGVYVMRYVLGLSSRTLALQTFFVRTVWTLFALRVTGLLEPLMDLLQDIGLTVGGTYISLLQVIQASVVVTGMLVLALWLGRAIERRLMRADALETHTRVIAVKLMRGLLVFVGVLVALPLVGIDSTFLSVLGGALGVGLGFALQKVASNYVCGFIILMDRSIRLGDVVTVEGRQGTVRRLDARCIALELTDGTVLLVPNETFLTQAIVNHTLLGKGVWRSLSVEVAYGSDLPRASEVILAAVQGQPRIMTDPAPSVTVTRFTGHGVELALQFCVADPGPSDTSLRSDMLLVILRGFRESGIAVPAQDWATPTAP